MSIIRRDTGIVSANASAFGDDGRALVEQRVGNRKRSSFVVDTARTVSIIFGPVELPPRRMIFLAVWPRIDFWPEMMLVTTGADPRVYIQSFDIFPNAPPPSEDVALLAQSESVATVRISQYAVDYDADRARRIRPNVDFPVAVLANDALRLAVGNEWDETRMFQMQLIGPTRAQ